MLYQRFSLDKKIKSALSIRHIAAVALLLCAVGLFYVYTHARAVELGDHSITLDTAQPGVVATYNIRFDVRTNATLGSVRVQFCAESSLIGMPCTPPPGFDLSAANLATQTGVTGFTKSPSSTANVLLLTRAPAAAAAGAAQYVLQNVKNPSGVGSFYVRIETFASVDATGPNIDYGGLAMATTDVLSIGAYVPPYLLFCMGTTIQAYDCTTVQGQYTDFGDFSTAKATSGHTQLLVATNAADGYAIRAYGTTLTSGNNIIPALGSPDVSRPGVSQFGLNLRANGTPPGGGDTAGPGIGQPAAGYGTPNFYKYISGDVIASSPHEDDYRLYTLSYLVNISKQQPAGYYVATLKFVTTASF